MSYSRAIIPFLALICFTAIFLLHFGNITRKIEKENYDLEDQISFVQDQININEVEFSLYNSFDYLSKVQKIYYKNEKIENFSNRISFNNIDNADLNDLQTIGTK